MRKYKSGQSVIVEEELTLLFNSHPDLEVQTMFDGWLTEEEIQIDVGVSFDQPTVFQFTSMNKYRYQQDILGTKDATNIMNFTDDYAGVQYMIHRPYLIPIIEDSTHFITVTRRLHKPVFAGGYSRVVTILDETETTLTNTQGSATCTVRQVYDISCNRGDKH